MVRRGTGGDGNELMNDYDEKVREKDIFLMTILLTMVKLLCPVSENLSLKAFPGICSKETITQVKFLKKNPPV